MSDTLNPRQRGTLVEALGSAVFHGGAAIGDVPALLRRVLQDEAWREFETATHQVVTYDRFEEFVTTPPTRGLGASIDLIKRIVSDDPATLDLLDRALQNPPSVHTAFNNVQGSESAPVGNSAEAALRRLRKDRPDLHERVIAGDLSPHAAMVEAGFRRRTVNVPVDDVGSVARTLRKNLDARQIDELVRLLTDN